MQQETSDAMTSSASDLAPGQTLLGRYRIIEQIGSGVTGVVYRAHDSKKGREIAVKVIHPELVAKQPIRDRFVTEARIACELFHPGVVKPTGVYSNEQISFITTELLEGRSLRQVMIERQKAHQSFTRQEILRIIGTLIDTLHYAQVRTVHRNLKPENIWVDNKNNYRIMDFGMAALVQKVRPTRKNPPKGIDIYVAPEQWKGWQQVDSGADQYAIGALAYELLSGKISARNINSVRRRYKKVNRNILSVIAKMMALDPANRFDSILLAKQALTETKSSTHSFLGSRTLRALAVILMFGLAVALLVESRDTLIGYWENIRPLSEAEKQLIFDDMIARANEVNRLDRLLRRSGNDLDARIRKLQNDIRNLDDELVRSISDSEKTQLRRQIDQVRIELVKQQKLKRFTDRLVFSDDSLQQLEGKIRQTFVLFEQGEHQLALELIAPIQADLERRLQQFDAAENYLSSRERMIEAHSTWREFNQSSGLQPPADIDQRAQAIADAENQIETGELAAVAEMYDRFARAYQADYLRDQQLLDDRTSYRAQRSTTSDLDTQLDNYLKQNNLEIDAAQGNALLQARNQERVLLERQDFSGAEASSRQIARMLSEYYTAAQKTVADAQRKLAEEQRKQAEEQRKQAEAQRKQAEEQRKRAEEQARKDREKQQKALAAAQASQSASSTNQATGSASKSTQSNNSGSNPALPSLQELIPGLELIDVPGGRFNMGSLDRGGERDEKPVREVSVNGFALMKHEVTFAQYDHYADLSGKPRPDDAGWGRGDRPVINVSWTEANAYAQWLSQSSGLKFRLPSEAEWEYAARAGTTTVYPWGNTASHEQANYGSDFCCSGLASGSDQWNNTAPVGAFAPNHYGINDMHGNVAEWVQDCWNDNYIGAPGDARAREAGHCGQRVVRGGSWSSEPGNIRSANRNSVKADKTTTYIGFRLVLQR